MGVIVNKENSKNDELSRRIDADLKARAVAESRADDPDYVEHEKNRPIWLGVDCVDCACDYVTDIDYFDLVFGLNQ